jgi:hypothetical protein
MQVDGPSFQVELRPVFTAYRPRWLSNGLCGWPVGARNGHSVTVQDKRQSRCPG